MVSEIVKKPIDIFHKNIIQKLILLLETRGLTEKTKKLITVIAVAIYYDRAIYEEEIEKAKEILSSRIKNRHKKERIYDLIRIKIDEYIKDEELFSNDIQKAIRYIIEDIQLYSIAKDIFEADDSNALQEEELEKRIKEEYDKHYTYKEGESILK